jgi:hypothetical protein
MGKSIQFAAIVAIASLVGALGLALLLSSCTSVLTAPTKVRYEPGAAKPVGIDAARLRVHVEKLASSPRARSIFNPEQLAAAGSYIADQLRAVGLTPEFMEYEVKGEKSGPVKVNNIRILLGPAGTPRIVVGAHYDAFEETPGADDNASAVAGLLELARVLAERKPQLACQLELVAFTLEEPPFFRTQAMGSAIHARYLVEKRIKVRAMICLEMIGCFTDEPGSQQMPMGWLRKYYPKEGNFILVVGALGGKKLTRTVKEAMIRASDLPVLSISAPKAIEGIDFSDHLNYWKHGFDAVMLTDTAFYRNPRYHTKDDTPDTLDYVRMAKVVEGLYSAVLALQKAP